MFLIPNDFNNCMVDFSQISKIIRKIANIHDNVTENQTEQFLGDFLLN